MLKKNNRSQFSDRELKVLKTLEKKSSSSKFTIVEISELSELTGIKDDEEVLRSLYTLEGKSLVAPEPFGDFTSLRWKITDVGLRAVKFLEQFN